MEDYPFINAGRWRAAADWWMGGILCVTVVACAVAYTFQVATFTHAKVGVLAAGTALAALGLILRGGLSWRGMRALLPLWAALCVVVCTGLFIRGVRLPAALVEESVVIALYLTAGLLAYELAEQRRWRRRFYAALVCSSVAVGVLGLVQFSGWAEGFFPRTDGNDQAIYSVFGNQDFFGGYVALGIALSLGPAVSRGRCGWPAMGALTVLLPALVLSSSRSAWAAAAVGGMVVLLHERDQFAWWRTALVAVLLAGTLAVGAVQYPERTLERVVYTFAPGDEGGHLRLWFWSGAALMVRDNPVAGVGLGNFRYWSPVYQGEALQAPGGEYLSHNRLHTLHAHSDPLEILAETGLIGAAFLLWMLVRLWRCAGREWAGIATLAAFTLVNSTLHSPPFAVAAVLLAVLLLARRRRIPLGDADSVPFAVSTVLFAGLLAIAAGWTIVWPSHLLAAAEDAHVAEEVPLQHYEAVFAHRWPNYSAHEGYAMALMDAGNMEDARIHLLYANEGIDTGRVHWLIGQTSLALGDEILAAESMRAVLARWPAHEGAWQVLYRLAGEEERAVLRAHAVKWGIGPSETMVQGNNHRGAAPGKAPALAPGPAAQGKN